MPETQTQLCLDEVIGNDTLEAMPQSAVKLLEISRQPDVGPNDLAVPIESDPGLSVQVLKFVNSSYFGFSRKISSIPLAINLVGFKTIMNFTLWNAIYSMIPNPKCDNFDLKGLWQDSLRRAVFGRIFAKRCGLTSGEEVFAGALMQDLAVPLLVAAKPDEYAKLLERSVVESKRLSELEEEHFGWNHAEVAAQCCTRWKFPESLVSMIRMHVQPTSKFPKTNAERVVSVCSLLPSVTYESWPEQARFGKCVRALVAKVTPETLLEETDAEFAKLAPSINVDANCKPLLGWTKIETTQ